MRRLLIGFVALLCSLAPLSAQAGSGKGILPHWVGAPSSGSNQSTTIWLSNITTHTLTVTATFYQLDGTVAPSSALSYGNFITSNTQLAAGTTGTVQIVTSGYNYGYAVGTWQNTGSDNDTLGLIGEGEFYQKLSSSSGLDHSIALNNWQPF